MNEATALFSSPVHHHILRVMISFNFFYFSKSNTNTFSCNFSLFLVNNAQKSFICPPHGRSCTQRVKYPYFLLERKLIQRLYKVTYGKSRLTALKQQNQLSCNHTVPEKQLNTRTSAACLQSVLKTQECVFYS